MINTNKPKDSFSSQISSLIPSDTSSIVVSPCTNICQLNAENICIGCYRSIDEITGWNVLSNEKKMSILEQIDIRKIKLSKK